LLIVGLLLAALLGKATDAGLASMGVTPHERLGAIVRWLLIALAVIATVDHLGFDVALVTDTFSNLLTIVVAGLVLAFAWGGREVARNVLAAYYVKENFRLGATVVVDGHEGRLEEIGSLNSRLVTPQGTVSVPNSRLVEQTVETKSPGES
jgi:small-conductance mechanosensitive channel